MSLNPDVRTEVLETLLSPKEMNGLTVLSKLLGVPKSTLSRSLINKEVERHGTAPPSIQESRRCPGAGRPASRANGAKGARNMRRSV